MITIDTGFSIAASAAVIAIASASAPTAAFAQDGATPKAEVVHCYGINTCKGTSDCKTATNECKGQNGCKGHGFKAMTAKACKAAGGSLTEPK